MNLVSVDEVRLRLRIDEEDDEADLLLLIAAASKAVANYLDQVSPYYLDSSGDPETDSSGDPVVLPEVKLATLSLVGEYYRNREGSQDGEIPAQWGYGHLPRAVVALLYSLRNPALA